MASVNESTTRPPAPADEISAAAAEFKKHMMGSDRKSLNLGLVRTRAEDMRKSLDQVIHALQYNAHNVHWHDALDKFAVLNVQYAHLLEQLRPMLKLWVVHPKSVNQGNAAVLPIMLATKQLPEMEASDAALLAAARAAHGVGPDGSLQAVYVALAAAEDAHNALVKHLTAAGEEPGGGVLDPKGPLRAELSAAMRAPPPPAAASGSRKRRAEGPALLLEALGDVRALRLPPPAAADARGK